jgi:hypothetical protein
MQGLDVISAIITRNYSANHLLLSSNPQLLQVPTLTPFKENGHINFQSWQILILVLYDIQSFRLYSSGEIRQE